MVGDWGFFGDFLRNIILPTAKKVGKSLLRTGAQKAAGVLSDVAQGAPIHAPFMRQMNPRTAIKGVKRKMKIRKTHATKRLATRRRTQDIFDI